jgi:hypothetical protein
MLILGVTGEKKCIDNGTIDDTLLQEVEYENWYLRQSEHGQTGNRESG